MCVHQISGQATSKALHYQCNLLFCVHNSFPQGGAYFPVEHLWNTYNLKLINVISRKRVWVILNQPSVEPHPLISIITPCNAGNTMPWRIMFIVATV